MRTKVGGKSGAAKTFLILAIVSVVGLPQIAGVALAELHAASVDDAAFLYVAHDVAPRAMSPKIKGFVQPKSWFVDFSPASMTP